MKRLVEEELLEWKNSPDRKPLVLLGIRQCGKTYILKEFMARHYRKVVHFDFEKDASLADLFWNLDPHRIVNDLSRKASTDIDTDTLIVFDEVQQCKAALSSLKYFCEDAPEYHVACAGSLLGLALSGKKKNGEMEENHTFPVGKVHFIRMWPMCFGEFIIARQGQPTFDFLESLKPGDEIPEGLMNVLKALYQEYLVVGGMPAAVETWCRTQDIAKVAEVQDDIIASFELSMGKYSGEDFGRITGLWRSAANQAAEAGDRFRLKDAGLTSKTIAGPLGWLLGADMLRRTWEVNDDKVPPKPRGGIHYKLYFPDVGLLCRKAGVDAGVLRSDDPRTSDIRGAVAENYVLEQLSFALDLTGDTYYWANGSGTAEVDFILEFGRKVAPVEVKSGKVGRMQSLDLYVERYRPDAAFVISHRNNRLGNGGSYTFIPLYMAWRFDRYAEMFGLKIAPSPLPPLPQWAPPGKEAPEEER